MDIKRIIRGMLVGWTAACLVSTAALAQATSQVKFQTSLGDFTVEVYPDKAPKTVENFLQYVKDKQYNGTIFHRVIGNFMVQGGGFTPDMNQKATREPIPLEAKNGLKNDRGTIAMARTSNPNSATAQFFVNVVDNNSLNAPSPDGYGYAVFGKVTAGMDTIDKIRAVPTGRQDVPVTPILINSATLVK
jgi:peptidyl-prolyl cis-trans isomerase A (cyclophilin A)